jgi:hypothetical protein
VVVPDRGCVGLRLWDCVSAMARRKHSQEHESNRFLDHRFLLSRVAAPQSRIGLDEEQAHN